MRNDPSNSHPLDQRFPTRSSWSRKDFLVPRETEETWQGGRSKWLTLFRSWPTGTLGGPKAEMSRSLGEDPKTVRKYVAPARAPGMAAGGPPLSEEQWGAKVRELSPALVDTRLRQPSRAGIERHRERTDALVGVVPATIIHQCLADEEGVSGERGQGSRHNA